MAHTKSSDQKKVPLMLDLFAGAGGMSLGLKKAGFRVVGAFEWNPEASATYQANNPGEMLVSGFGPEWGDMSIVSPKKLADELRSHGVRSGSNSTPGDLDLIAAGPPCQGFSRVGRGKLNSLAGKVGAFLHDPRNQLYRKVLDVVRAVMPKVVLLENVPGILHLSGTNMAEVISKALEDIGYDVRYTVLNAAWYGVPQTRERVFILGFHKGLRVKDGPAFPEIQHMVKAARGALTSNDLSNDGWKYYTPLSQVKTHPSWTQLPVSAEEALSDLPIFMKHLEYVDRWGYTIKKGYKSIRENHPAVPYRRAPQNHYQKLMRTWCASNPLTLVGDHYCRWVPRDFWTFAEMQNGDNYIDALMVAERRYHQAVSDYKEGWLDRRPLKKDFIPPYSSDGFHEKWKKLYRDRPSWTITAHLGKDTYSHIHYDSLQARAITPREAARLQSFPDNYQFCGCSGDMFRQIGNAVPPLLAFALGVSIREQLKAVDHSRASSPSPSGRQEVKSRRSKRNVPYCRANIA
jgi:DNA (cytosine-5)-methyltransferase 1